MESSLIKNMSQKDYLYLLRRFSKIETLELIIHHKEVTLNEDELIKFYGAADHRLAELITGKLFDKVPKSVWHLVR